MVVRRIKNDELTHHGVKGQRWGVRRYQNANGTLTVEGKAKLEKLREKHGNEVQRRIDANEAAHQKSVKKLSPKLIKAMENAPDDNIVGDKKVKKIQNKMVKEQARYDNNKKLLERELSVVKNYTLSDFKKEKKYMTGVIATDAAVAGLIAAGASMAVTAGGAALGASAALSNAVSRGAIVGAASAGRSSVIARSAYRQSVGDKKDKYGANISDKAAKYYNQGNMEAYKAQLEKDKRRYGE